MSTLSELEQSLEQIEETIGHTFKEKSLLILAFTHRSYVNENKQESSGHNERLEFLGDSVLNLVIAQHLFLLYPSKPEGELSSLRARLVETASCENFIKRLALEKYVLLGKGEQINLGKARSSIIADLFEAVLGAIFLDGGFKVAQNFILSQFENDIESILDQPYRNYKAELQDFSQKRYQKAPFYEILAEEGPDHNKEFLVNVVVNDTEVGRGVGSSKKEAQQNAAKAALKQIDL
ncbi:MAG: ribonuclease III [Chlamydiales bacterium]|nr:ribonuclease III [Chlamydiales bacterium]